MKIYNTLTRKKENFNPINSKEVLIYSCGPTVYNYIHLGNARPLCVFDVLRRFLEYKGYHVKYVQNFTDIDDKIINKALEEKVDFQKISKRYIEEFNKDSLNLNVREATVHPLATENIFEIIKLIKKIIEKGFAYVLPSGDVYFRTRKFKTYGKLSGQTIDDLQSGARINIDKSKEDPLDFALWKSSKPEEPFWESPWGSGRPGWHIECSCMVKRYLGDTIDIHCGGQDLIFPHHENEIAQSECLLGTKLANYWMHNGYINIDNEKMSKSKNNFFTVREIAKEYGYEPIRYLMISSHYRNPINYTQDVIKQCQAAVQRLYNFKKNLEFALKKSSLSNKDVTLNLDDYKSRFIKALDDDLNTADAIGVVFELVKDVNSNIFILPNQSSETLKKVKSLFSEFMKILGLLYEENSFENSKLDSEIESLIKLREKARKEKNWELSDKIRDSLSAKGIILEDTPQGTKFSFK